MVYAGKESLTSGGTTVDYGQQHTEPWFRSFTLDTAMRQQIVKCCASYSEPLLDSMANPAKPDQRQRTRRSPTVLSSTHRPALFGCLAQSCSLAFLAK